MGIDNKIKYSIIIFPYNYPLKLPKKLETIRHDHNKY